MRLRPLPQQVRRRLPRLQGAGTLRALRNGRRALPQLRLRLPRQDGEEGSREAPLQVRGQRGVLHGRVEPVAGLLQGETESLSVQAEEPLRQDRTVGYVTT